ASMGKWQMAWASSLTSSSKSSGGTALVTIPAYPTSSPFMVRPVMRSSVIFFVCPNRIPRGM
ncbi:MAG: hypothetical protein QGH72_02625, partial [Dehalococcoidia bacterium]|nr:hypothetical protein [Dehalococcoidia bacterium]